MGLKTIVKVGNITNLSDARYCAGMGVNLAGFPIDQNHPNFITKEIFTEISKWISGVDIVGEVIDDIPGDLDVELVQFSNPALVQVAELRGLNYIFSIDLMEYSGLSSIPSGLKPEYYLLENVDHIQIELLEEIIDHLNAGVLVGYNISPENADLYLNTSAVGIALLGSDEDKPGYKDYDSLADILECLEE